MTVKIEADICEDISYMLYNNNQSAISRISIINDGNAIDGLDLKISSDIRFFEPIEIHIDRIAERSEVCVTNAPFFRFKLIPEFFTDLTEDMNSEIRIELFLGTDILTKKTCEVRLLTFDRWPGIGVMPETIASFVTPNADSLKKVRSRAADILFGWKVDNSFDGYNGDLNKVRCVVSALYDAVCENNISYILPPTDYEESGQRIRMPDDVLRAREGTCIDLAVLFASLFESVGLHSIIFFTRGHAFVGVHLRDDRPYQMVEFESGLYRNEISDSGIIALECTFVVSSVQQSFGDAIIKGRDNLEKDDDFNYAIEIESARAKIRPLPTRRMEDGSWVVEKSNIELGATMPDRIELAKPIDECYKKLTTIDKWKRDLLDLTARNYLIKMKLGKRFLPLLVPDINLFEEGLYGGKKIHLGVSAAAMERN